MLRALLVVVFVGREYLSSGFLSRRYLLFIEYQQICKYCGKGQCCRLCVALENMLTTMGTTIKCGIIRLQLQTTFHSSASTLELHVFIYPLSGIKIGFLMKLDNNENKLLYLTTKNRKAEAIRLFFKSTPILNYCNMYNYDQFPTGSTPIIWMILLLLQIVSSISAFS